MGDKNGAIAPFDPPAITAFFGSDDMRACFHGAAQLQAWLDVEAALARAQAQLEIIPASAARAISRAAKIVAMDTTAISVETVRTGHPVVPLVRALVEAAGPRAGKYVHLGATTQDIMDTGYVLLARNGLAIVDRQLAVLARILKKLARRYRATPVAGRTHGQQALPTTFGLRMVGWYDEIQRHQARLKELRPRLLVGSFGGAVGTLAGYGPKALALRRAVMRGLGLGEPATSWHANQDRFAECISILGLIGSSGEKIAREIYLLGRSEIGEAFEPQTSGQVGSSTMPQKQNPIRSEAVIAAAQLLRAQVPVAQNAIVAQDDRDMGTGMALWKLVPDSFVLLGGILERLIDVLAGWQVDVAAMSRNLERSSGAIMSEAVMLRLAEWIPRHDAHEIVADAARRSSGTGGSFFDCLRQNKVVSRHISAEELRALLDPESYLGAATAIVDQVVGPRKRGATRKRTSRKRS